MRDGLRILGLGVLLAGLLTLGGLLVGQPDGAVLELTLNTDLTVARAIAGFAAALYLAAGVFLLFLRRMAAVLFIFTAVAAAALVTYDMASAAGAGLDALGVMRNGLHIFSLTAALLLTALTVPLVRRRVLI